MKSEVAMNKYFFSIKEHPLGGLITKLYDEDDALISSVRILHGSIIPSTPSCMYACPAPDEQNEQCCAKSLRHVPCKLSRTTHKVLEATIREEELTTTVHVLAK